MAPRVLVVGSLNVDLFHSASIQLGGKPVDINAVKGMTLPAKSFVENPAIASQLKEAGLQCAAGEEEKLVLKMDGPFEQKTGGKGANAAAAAGQTFSAELICNFGEESAEENKMLLSDLKKFGDVDTGRSGKFDGPTGTAYILSFDDGDNAIVLLGGANQSWDAAPLGEDGSKLHTAITESVAVMLQREIPEYVNVEVARVAQKLGKPVFMDVGGTDAPLDKNLMPFLSEIAPNESELTFISGVETKVGDEIKKDLVRKAVAALKAKFAEAGNTRVEVLVTLGSKGAMHFSPDWTNGGVEDATGLLPHESQVGSYKLETEDGKPKDTTGAGDCFRGSYVAARYGQGKDLAEALKWAAAAGSLAVSVHGAMPSMPCRSDIEARTKKEVSNGLCSPPGTYKAETVQAAWDNHFGAFGAQDVPKIMLDYTEASVLKAFDHRTGKLDECKGMAEIQKFFQGLFATLKDCSDLAAPTIEVEEKPKQVYLVWSCGASGIVSATDTFIFDVDNKIRRQNIAFTSKE